MSIRTVVLLSSLAPEEVFTAVVLYSVDLVGSTELLFLPLQVPKTNI